MGVIVTLPYTISLKLRKTMGLTQAELNFYTRVPNLLAQIAEELKKLNKTLAENSEKGSEKKESEE